MFPGRSRGRSLPPCAALLALLALTAAALAGCGDDGGGNGTTYTASGSAVEVAVGQRFTIALESNPSTGYTWQLAQDPSGVVTLVDQDLEQGGDGRIGAAGTQRFVFEGVRAGTTTLELQYVRPWEQGVAPADTATFAVTVT